MDFLSLLPPEIAAEIATQLGESELPSDPIEYERQMAELSNRQPGSLTGMDCPLCLNRGYSIVVNSRGDRVAKDCSCLKQRRTLKYLEKSGLAKVLNIYTFDAWESREPWQKEFYDTAKDYAAHPAGWFCAVGRPGTGKTYLAVACAVAAFREKAINRIILTRPAVEAGEKLGFLPGDLQNKVDPYLRPLYDALFDMLGPEAYQRYLERGNVEVAPLAYMRGRTLDDAFIILDEAQNTTPEQMKMFLTRLGFNSKVVITGDVTQIDLPDGKKSGLKEAIQVLNGVEDIAICRLDHTDVVRHELVGRIIQAYEQHAEHKEKEREKKAKFYAKPKN